MALAAVMPRIGNALSQLRNKRRRRALRRHLYVTDTGMTNVDGGQVVAGEAGRRHFVGPNEVLPDG